MIPNFDSLPLYQFSEFNNFLLGMLILRKKIFLILYPPLENSTTRITITYYVGRSHHCAVGLCFPRPRRLLFRGAGSNAKLSYNFYVSLESFFDPKYFLTFY